MHIKCLSELDVGEIWGVGRKLAPKLAAMGYKSVLDLKRADPGELRRHFSVVMEKTIRELNGTVCIEMEEIPPPRQQIISSRSFGMPVTTIDELGQSISLYVSRAAEKGDDLKVKDILNEGINLCAEIIKKILIHGKQPDWDSIMLGKNIAQK